MKPLSVLIVMFVATIILGGFLRPSYANPQKGRYMISHVEHEGIINYYVPLLKKAYKKLGISPSFVLINDQRALRLLDDGIIDADTAKALDSIGKYQNIIYLPKPISHIEVFLICQNRIKCDLSVLNHNRKSIAVISPNEFYSELFIDSTINLVELTSFDVVYKMFDQQKVDVALIVLDSYTKRKLEKYPNHYKISEKWGYHLINRKHEDLIVPLQQAIDEVLAEGNFAITPQSNTSH